MGYDVNGIERKNFFYKFTFKEKVWIVHYSAPHKHYYGMKVSERLYYFLHLIQISTFSYTTHSIANKEKLLAFCVESEFKNTLQKLTWKLCRLDVKSS